MVVSNRNLLSRGLFSGAMLVSGRVPLRPGNPKIPTPTGVAGGGGVSIMVLALAISEPKIGPSLVGMTWKS